MKYPGVTIDARTSFKDHLTNAGLKALKVPHVGGPKTDPLLAVIISRFFLFVYSRNNPSITKKLALLIFLFALSRAILQ